MCFHFDLVLVEQCNLLMHVQFAASKMILHKDTEKEAKERERNHNSRAFPGARNLHASIWIHISVRGKAHNLPNKLSLLSSFKIIMEFV